MTSFDTYYVTEDDAQQVEATLRDLWGALPYWPNPTLAYTPLITGGPLMRLVAATQSMWDRSDGNTSLWTGNPYSRSVKGDEFPISGAALMGSEGRHSHMAVVWESTGGIWSDRAWRLDATLHIEVDLDYGDTRVSLTNARLRVTGREAGGKPCLDDGGVAGLPGRPARAAPAGRALRVLGAVGVRADW